jgi:hypothetical protein
LEGGAGDDTLPFDWGTRTLRFDLGAAPQNIEFVTVTGGQLILDATQHLQGVTITGDTLTMKANGSRLLVTSSLTINVTAGAKLDLKDNDMIVHGGSLSGLTAWIKSGLENGGAYDWLGPGIMSSKASADNATAGSFLYALGIILNDLAQVGGSGPIYADFGGETGLGTDDVLVKFTYFGDADISGAIDATDYSLTDNGYVNSLSGWINGDFDYSGAIDATDYALIDNAYVNQQGALSPLRDSGDRRSTMAEELFGSWKYDLGTAEQMIQRHEKQFGSDYDDALEAIRGGKLGLNPLLWFVVVPTAEEREHRHL